MNQRIVCGHGERDLNRKLEALREDYLVTITHLSTSRADEKLGRYEESITVVVDLYKPIKQGRLA